MDEGGYAMIAAILSRLRAFAKIGKLRYCVKQDNHIITGSATAREVKDMIYSGRIHDTAFITVVVPEGDKDLEEEYGGKCSYLYNEGTDLPRPIRRILKPGSFFTDLVMMVIGVPLVIAAIITGCVVVYTQMLGLDLWPVVICSLLIFPMITLFPPYTGGSIIPGIVAWIIIGILCFNAPPAVSEIPNPLLRFIAVTVIAPPSIAFGVMASFGLLGILLAFIVSPVLGSILGLFARLFMRRIPKGFYVAEREEESF